MDITQQEKALESTDTRMRHSVAMAVVLVDECRPSELLAQRLNCGYTAVNVQSGVLTAVGGSRVWRTSAGRPSVSNTGFKENEGRGCAICLPTGRY